MGGAADEPLAAAIRQTAAARSSQERRDFLFRAGKELARLLAGDRVRLTSLLARFAGT